MRRENAHGKTNIALVLVSRGRSFLKDPKGKPFPTPNAETERPEYFIIDGFFFSFFFLDFLYCMYKNLSNRSCTVLLFPLNGHTSLPQLKPQYLLLTTQLYLAFQYKPGSSGLQTDSTNTTNYTNSFVKPEAGLGRSPTFCTHKI